MFAYCGNNPVMYVDLTGLFFESVKTIFASFEELLTALIKTPQTYFQLQEMEFSDVTLGSAFQCSKTLLDNNIDTPQEKAHFFAQCYAESHLSLLEAGWLSENRAEAYRKKKAYYPYYGAGHLQLTWEANYKAFSEDMNDPLILSLGPQYVAQKYAWTSAGWYWSERNVNSYIEKGSSVKTITKLVRGGTGGYEEREKKYFEFLRLF